MRKYEHMGREEFLEIYRRQTLSGLNIEDFCINECYSKSSFYYWKRKYIGDPEGQEKSNRKIPEGTAPDGMAPIHIKAENTALALKEKPPVERIVRERSEILISFPGGLRVTFRGKSNSRAAIDMITKIYSSNVLPE